MNKYLARKLLKLPLCCLRNQKSADEEHRVFAAMFVLFVLARKALWVNHLNFEGGGGEGGGRIGLCKTFFSHWPVFLSTEEKKKTYL